MANSRELKKIDGKYFYSFPNWKLVQISNVSSKLNDVDRRKSLYFFVMTLKFVANFVKPFICKFNNNW